MAKEVIVNVKITAQQAKKNIEELNKSLNASESLIDDLEDELVVLNKTLEKQAGVTDKALNARVKTNKEIEKTTNKIQKEKRAIKDITKERQKNNKIIQQSTKQTADYSGVIGILDRQTGGAISGITGITGSVGKATGGFKLLRVAIIGTGIGALVIAIASLTAAFTSSEEGQNRFRKLMTQIGVVVGNITDILADFGNAIIDAVTNPMESIKSLGSGIINFIKNPIDTLTNAFGSAKQAVTEFVDETQKELEIAGQIADQRAKADLLERKLLIDRAEATRKFNELREKAADKENVSIEDRIAALKEAGRIEEEITLKEIEAARLRFEAKKQQNELSNSTKDDLDEQARLEARLIELEASRLKKQKTLTAEITTNLREAESERKRIEAEKRAEEKAAQAEKDAEEKERKAQEAQAEKELADLKKQIREAEAVTDDEKKQLEIQKQTEHYDNLIALAKKNGIDTANLETAKQNKLDSLKKQDVKTTEITEKQKLQLTSQAFGAIAGILGEASKAGKAFATGQALINTYQGVTEVLATKSTLPEPFATISRVVNIATVLATGLQTVRKINQVKPMQQGGGSVGSLSSAGGSAVTPSAPAFNIVGADTSNQLAQTLATQTQKPVKAFVVSGDVTTAQSLDRNIIQESSLG